MTQPSLSSSSYLRRALLSKWLWGAIFVATFFLFRHFYAFVPLLAGPLATFSYQETELQDYRGGIHVHTQRSHDSDGTLDEIVRAARKNHYDFLAITDHNVFWTPGERPDSFGGKPLLIFGEEFSADKAGHILGLGLGEDLTPLRKHDGGGDLLGAIHEGGGLGIVCHPAALRRSWEAWDLPFDAMEIYSLSTDVRSEGPGRFPLIALMALLAPREAPDLFMDPPEAELARWDSLHRSRRVTGVAGVDAHKKPYLFFLSAYEHPFSLVTTHVFAEALSEEAVLAALKKGRAYVAYEREGLSAGFRFDAAETQSGKIHFMGAEFIAGDSPVVLSAEAPSEASFHLIKDGKELARYEGRRFEHIAGEPGVYRVEVWKKRSEKERLWILSNPIYLR